MTRWLIGAGVAFFLLSALLLFLAAYTGFADVPCQDGIWDEAKQTCVPTGG